MNASAIAIALRALADAIEAPEVAGLAPLPSDPKPRRRTGRRLPAGLEELSAAVSAVDRAAAGKAVRKLGLVRQ